ncbi:trypsin-like serine protease [Candidatus Poriferisodalis sp.]|uniref:trypsin-like serine protease n=1 Tax=Candidatus Poriferisodalis sp. TaxID=3101277 RepID=UPI003B01A279
MGHRHPHRPQAASGGPLGRGARQLLAVLVAAAALGALLPTAAHAASAPDDESATHPVVASYASDYSVTYAEAQRRLERIPQLQEIIASLHELEADRLAGWGLDHRGALTAWVLLTGHQPPSSPTAAIAAAHADVEIRTGAASTFAQLVAAQDRFGFGEVVGPVGNTGAVDSDAAFSDAVTHTGIDLRANALEIGIHTANVPIAPSVTPGGELPDDVGPVGSTGENSQRDAAVLRSVRVLLAPHIDVSFDVVSSEPLVDEVAFEGGRSMGTCTSGFTAIQNGTGRQGIITAGHCRGRSRQTQGVTVAEDVRHWHRFVDAALYLIPQGQNHSVTHRIRCNTDLLRPETCAILSIGPNRLQMNGHYVCHFGIGSAASCGTVDNVSVRPNPSSGCDVNGTSCAAVFVRATGPDMRSCSGDSGGPVYSYSAAYGIHKGSNSGNNCDRPNTKIYFSAIRRVQNYLDVSVVTG